MDYQISIGFKRRLAFAFAVVFAVLAVTGAWQAVSNNDPLRLLIVLVAFGGAAAAFAARAVDRNPVLVLDEQGLTDRRRGDVIRWSDIEAVHVAERRGHFDRYHDLVLTLTRERTLRLPLDQLTRSWSEVAELIEGRLGRQVAIRREGGLIGRARARALPS